MLIRTTFYALVCINVLYTSMYNVSYKLGVTFYILCTMEVQINIPDSYYELDGVCCSDFSLKIDWAAIACAAKKLRRAQSEGASSALGVKCVSS